MYDSRFAHPEKLKSTELVGYRGKPLRPRGTLAVLVRAVRGRVDV